MKWTKIDAGLNFYNTGFQLSGAKVGPSPACKEDQLPRLQRVKQDFIWAAVSNDDATMTDWKAVNEGTPQTIT